MAPEPQPEAGGKPLYERLQGKSKTYQSYFNIIEVNREQTVDNWPKHSEHALNNMLDLLDVIDAYEKEIASQQREIERLRGLARRAATTIKVLLDAANTLAVLQGSLVKSPETEAFIDALRKAGGGTGNE